MGTPPYRNWGLRPRCGPPSADTRPLDTGSAMWGGDFPWESIMGKETIIPVREIKCCKCGSIFLIYKDEETGEIIDNCPWCEGKQGCCGI